MLEKLLRVALVDLHPGAENFGVHVIVPLFNESPSLHSPDQGFHVLRVQYNNLFDLNVLFQKIGLRDGSGNPVEKKELLIGEVAVGCNEAVQVVVPDLNRNFIREELSFACITVIELASRGFRG